MTTEENGNLPNGWTYATIDDLIPVDGVFNDGDWVESKDQDANGDVRLIQLADVGDGQFNNKSNRHLTKSKSYELGCTFLKKGDLLIARMPDPLGRCCIFPLAGDESFVTVVDVCLVRLLDASVHPKFLMHLLNSPSLRAEISDRQSGSTRKRISRGNLAKITLPIPPLKEQRRIVAKIEELFSELDKGVEAMTTAGEQLKIYRLSVLGAALSGYLTGANAKDWPRYTVGQLITDVRYGTAKKCTFDPSKTPVLRIPNVAGGRIDLSNLKHTDFDEEELEKLRLEVGDILIVRSNGSVSLVGLSAVVTEGAVGYAYAGYLIRLRLEKEKVLPEFLNICFHSLPVRVDIERQARSTSGVHNINGDEIRAISLRIPPMDQQREIVALLKEKWSYAEASETYITTELQRSVALRQSILKKAFSGQLVSQDPTDEPATELLKRIRAERAKASASKTERETKKIRKEKETAA